MLIAILNRKNHKYSNQYETHAIVWTPFTDENIPNVFKATIGCTWALAAVAVHWHNPMTRSSVDIPKSSLV